MPTIRCFIGLPVPDSVASAALEVQESVARRAKDSFRMVPRESLHVTLAFLGDVREGEVSKLSEQLGTVRHPAFTLRLGKLLALPKPAVPRVLAMELDGEVRPAMELADKVRALASPIGSHQETKPFLAHLTIGRLRRGSKGMSREAQAGLTTQRFGPAPSWKVDRFQLVQSHLDERGPRYQVLAEFLLLD